MKEREKDLNRVIKIMIIVVIILVGAYFLYPHYMWNKSMGIGEQMQKAFLSKQIEEFDKIFMPDSVIKIEDRSIVYEEARKNIEKYLGYHNYSLSISSRAKDKEDREHKGPKVTIMGYIELGENDDNPFEGYVVLEKERLISYKVKYFYLYDQYRDNQIFQELFFGEED